MVAGFAVINSILAIMLAAGAAALGLWTNALGTINASHAIRDAVEGTRDRGQLVVSTRCDQGMVEIAVTDSGGGIPETIRDKIFDPFFTTKSVGQGTGQGLAIARSAVERHGGTLTFDTELGVGTTFRARLPIAA